MTRHSLGAVALAAAFALGAAACVPDPSPDTTRRTVASNLSGPFGLASANGRLLVAESDAGRITRVDPRTGRTVKVVDGLTSPADVARVGGNRLVIVTGGSEVPDASITGDASVLIRERGQEPEVLADLEAYELEANPDGQLQFDPDTNAPLDALSNPFAVIAQRGPGLVLVADAGANDVLSVAEDGTVSTFFVPPLVTTGACEGAPNNDPEHAGCDPVPTGLAYGPGNTLYVSTLSAEVPGEGRVYVLDATTAEVRDVLTGFDGPTGVEVAPDGTVYVSEVTYGAPAPDGPPPPDFDPSQVGRIVRVRPDGSRAAASVPMPLGMVYEYGTLFTTAYSIAGFFGMSEAGTVVALRPSAFEPLPPAPPDVSVPEATVRTA